MLRFEVVAILGLAAVIAVNGFNFQLNSQCDNTGNQAAVPRACYDGPCPTNTVRSQIGCAGIQICCEGTPACQTMDCNNGTCVNDGAVESCECDPGFNGTFCEFDMCDSMNTTCSNETLMCNRLPAPELFNCTCNDGWSGPLCEVDECALLTCVNGSCNPLSAPDFAECACDPGFSGPACDIDACDPDPCMNGNCTREINGNYSCECEEPFFGYNCTDEICDTVPCENDGTCTSNTETNFTCECTDDWTGYNCSIPVCIGDNSECNFNGTCTPTGNGNFECDCFVGFAGEFCETAELPCGIEQMTRLMGAPFDTPGGNPFLVRIGLGSITYCTGVLIAKQYVVTDLLCGLLANVSGSVADVIVGDYNVTEYDDTEVTYGIEEITINNSPYTTLTEAGNALGTDLDALLPYMAVIKLNDTITKGYAINNACPPKVFDSVCNATCKISGYGGTIDVAGSAYTGFRQSAPFSLANDRLCGAFRGSAFPETSGCGVSLLADSGICQGDNGGAVVCQDEVTLQWHLQGIIQFRTDPANGHEYCSDQVVYYSDMNAMWSFVDGVINA